MDVTFRPEFSFTFEDIERNLGKDIALSIQRALYKIAQNGARYAKERCPVLTGALKASIYASGTNVDLSLIGDVDKKISQTFVRSVRRAVKKHAEYTFNRKYLHGTETARDNQFLGTASKLNYPEALISNNPRDRDTKPIYTNQGIVSEDRSFNQFDIPNSETFYFEVGSKIYYASYVENGHEQEDRPRVEAQPFLAPAFLLMKTRVDNLIAKIAISPGDFE